MAKTYKEKLKELYNKIKTIKNIEIIVAVIVIAVIILLYSVLSTDSPGGNTSTTDYTEESENEYSLTEQVEAELVKVLSQIDGAGEVDIIITYTGTSEKVIANTKSTHTSTSGGSVSTSTSTVTETPIVINSNGASKLYVIKELMPDIKGVVVVAEGAKNAKVRLELMRAVQTILDINANSIEIFAMK